MEINICRPYIGRQLLDAFCGKRRANWHFVAVNGQATQTTPNEKPAYLSVSAPED